MERGLAAAAVACMACGRVAFDPVGAASGTGPDAADGSGDGPAPNFCATVTPVPTLCADFDTSLDPASGFSAGPTLVNGGMVDLSTTSKSGPRALVSGYANPAPESAYSQASIPFMSAGVVSQIQLDYEVLIPMTPVSGHLESQNITITTASAGTFFYDLDLYQSAPDHFLQERSFGTFMSMPVNIPQVSPGTWHHVQLTLNLSAATHTFSIDGMTVSSGATNFPVTPGMAELDVGMNYEINSATANQIYVDNVVLYWQ